MVTCHALPPPSGIDASQFCRPVNTAHRFAVLGIFSVESAWSTRARSIIRPSWLAQPSNISAHFVLRGLSIQQATVDEAARHGDMLFLRERPGGCQASPLTKLFLWLSCATQAWPNALMVGKADDDVWAHLPGIEMHMRRSLARAAPQSSMLWGQLETYSWHEEAHRPIAFTWRYGWHVAHEHCRRRSSAVPVQRNISYGRLRSHPWDAISGRVAAGSSSSRGGGSSSASADGGTASHSARHHVLGPFHFAKGPCYFLSSALASDVLASEWVKAELAATLASIRYDQTEYTGKKELTWPWEDVFLGLALSQAANASGRSRVITAVHIGTNVWQSLRHMGSGFLLSPSTLVWHDTSRYVAVPKRPERIGTAHRWASEHHCTPRMGPKLSCHTYAGCSGARWRRCLTVYPRGDNCSQLPVELADAPLPPAPRRPPRRRRAARGRPR